jgi:porin
MKNYLLLILLLILTFQAYGQEEGESVPPRLGGPDQVENRMTFDNLVQQPIFELSFLNPYFDFKDSLTNKIGLSFSTEYSAIAFGSNSKMGKKSSSGGIWKFLGAWEMFGRKSGNSGALIFKVEHRHKYSTVALKDYGFNIGFVGLIEPPFSNDRFRFTNLYWRQRLAKGRLALIAGFLDVTDFFDVYALASPWLHFTNFNFSTGVAAVNVPNDAYLGFAAGGWITKKIYMVAGIGDINSDLSNPFKGFETFFNKTEFFKHVEIGITSAKDYMFLDNIHLSLWQRDATSATGDPNGWGLVVSGTKYITEKLLPFVRFSYTTFVRFSYTKDAGSLLQTALAVGIGYQHVPGSHLLGFGYSWGQVNENSFGEGLPDQHIFELFYRIQLSSRIAVTPDIQYIINPALNELQSSLFLWGIRGRIAL